MFLFGYVQSWSALREAWQACSGDLPNSTAAATVVTDSGNVSLEGNAPNASNAPVSTSCHFPGVCRRLYITAVPGTLMYSQLMQLCNQHTK